MKEEKPSWYTIYIPPDSLEKFKKMCEHIGSNPGMEALKLIVEWTDKMYEDVNTIKEEENEDHDEEIIF